MALGVAQLPDLSIEQRVQLFKVLLTLQLDGSTPVQVRFGERAGWVFTDPLAARVFLRRRDLLKGRRHSSQESVGGYVARDGKEFRRRRSDVIVALARAAASRDAMRAALDRTITSWPKSRRVRPAQFTQWMLHDLIGPEPGSVDLDLLIGGICEAERSAERSQVGRPVQVATPQRSSLQAQLCKDARFGSGAFVVELRKRGWSPDDIAEEVVGLALAGWESTAAAVTSGRTLGLGPVVDDEDIGRLLQTYPPSWLIVRELPEGTDWGAPGDLVAVSPWLLHRSQIVAPPIPFGAGPRKCPADFYARTQIAVALRAFGGKTAVEGRAEILDRRSAALVPLSDRTNKL